MVYPSRVVQVQTPNPLTGWSLAVAGTGFTIKQCCALMFGIVAGKPAAFFQHVRGPGM